MRLLEEIDDGLRHHVADAVDLVQPLQGVRVGHGVAQVLKRAEALGEELGRGLAHMPDAEREDEALERNRAPRFDGREKIGGGLRAPALLLGQLRRRAAVARLQRENVGGRANAAFLEKRLDVFFAKALDIEGEPRHEMTKPLNHLRGADEAARAAAHHVELAGLGVGLAHGVACRPDICRETRREPRLRAAFPAQIPGFAG